MPVFVTNVQRLEKAGFPLFSALIFALTTSAWFSTQSAEQTQSAAKVSVMTYNLRYASQRPPNAWPDRRPLMKECIEQYSPDIIGTQEGVFEQLKDLAADLKEYAWIGTGREGGSKGEFMAIFYLREKFDPLEFDHFWLSDTPNVIGSATWGNSVRRMVTWVRFKHKPTGREFYLFNTHFDHQVQASREKSADLLRSRIAGLNTKLPIIVTGDFNAGPENPVYATMLKDDLLFDTWSKAPKRTGEGLGTFNGFKALAKNGNRIDWILARGPVQVEASEIVTFSKDGQFPSDHCPVVAWLSLAE